jgi:hypothetical protein
MLKFLYFSNSTTDAAAIPATLLRKMEISAIGSTDTLHLEFQDVQDGIGKVTKVTLTATHDKGREVKEAIANAIRKSSSPLIVIADELNNQFVHPDVIAVTSVDLT